MKRALPGWTLPLVLLVIAGISHGLLITQLGFYWDDWPFLLIAGQQGPEGYAQFFAYDRPTTAWSYWLLMPLFGTNPLAWHIFGLVMRAAAGAGVAWLAASLWPNARHLAAWAALLFVVFPVFKQQSIALVYHQLWIQYAAFLVSLAAMAAAVRHWRANPRRYWGFTLLALAGLAVNLVISEYFLGVELLRGVIIWQALERTPAGWRKRLGHSLRLWLPYLAITLAYIVWRMFLVRFPEGDRNATVLINGLLADPLRTVPQLAQMVLQDSLHIFLSNWYDTLRPELFQFTTPFLALAWGAALAAGLIVFVYLRWFRPAGEPEDAPTALRAAGAAAVLGALLMLFGPAPAWSTGRMVTEGAFSDRLALPAMLGASLLLAGLAGWLLRTRLQQIVLISLLVGLAAGSNLRQANEFRWTRISQNRLFWQLYWRAPYILPGTALLADGEILPKMGLRSTSYAINLIYPPNRGTPRLNYWFFSLGREFSHQMPELLAGLPFNVHARQFTFEGSSQDSLVLYYQPEEADCLRVLTPQDAADPDLPAVSKQALPLVNLGRIDPVPRGHRPSEDIYGAEPPRGWCYLFQKADLARQLGDWPAVAALGDQARAQGYSLENSQSNTPQEWVPFIEGYARAGRWQEAAQISADAAALDPQMAPHLCGVWQSLAAFASGRPEPENTVRANRAALGCAP